MTDHFFSGLYFYEKERMCRKIKIVTLKLNKEFKRAYYQGKFKAHPLLVTYLLHSKEKYPRIGITTSKKIGDAVSRNRARRIIKQAYRELCVEQAFNLNGYDLVFVARGDTKKVKTQEIKFVMKKQIYLLLSSNKNNSRKSKGNKNNGPKV